MNGPFVARQEVFVRHTYPTQPLVWPARKMAKVLVDGAGVFASARYYELEQIPLLTIWTLGRCWAQNPVSTLRKRRENSERIPSG